MKKVVLLQEAEVAEDNILDELLAALNAFCLVAGRTRPGMPC